MLYHALRMKSGEKMELFVHVTGSVPRESDSDAIALTKRTAYETARALLREKIGVGAPVGATPNEKTLPFDRVKGSANKWRGENHPAFDELTDAKSMDVVIRGEWPHSVAGSDCSGTRNSPPDSRRVRLHVAR